MRNDKHIAEKLRRKGKSYREIEKELGIPRSTLSEWFADKQWSQDIKKKLNTKNNWIAKQRLAKIIKRRKLEWKRWRQEHREEARKEFPKLIQNPLFVAGVHLYWGEGDHKLENGCVKLGNVDPRLIKIFVLFLRRVLEVPNSKLRIQLILYPDLDDQECRDYWSKVTGVSHFYKTQYIKGRHPTKKSEYGICAVVVNSRGIKEKIFVWKELMYKNYT